MGWGHWDNGVYRAAAGARAAAGQSDFGYTAKMRGVPRHQRKAAPVLDPYEVQTREARDSADHPNATPIVVLFDVTGSMGTVPVILQKRLCDLLGLLTRGGYVDDPQIMVGAIGDDIYDAVPLQVGQFESDNRIDEQLREIYLEGGGGGNKREGYALGAYFLNTRARTDAWEKRGKKGYVFFIGDELNMERVYAKSITNFLGDNVRQDLDVEQVYAELQEKWNVYYVLPNMTAYYNDPEIEDHWRGLLGENFLRLEDPAAICDLIAVTIGLTEGAIDLDEGLADLADLDEANPQAVGAALATYRPQTALAITGGTAGLLPPGL